MAELPFYEESRYEHLRNSLQTFQFPKLETAALDLFYSLGYASNKRLPGLELTPYTLTETFTCPRSLDADRASLSEWKSVHFLFQLLEDDLFPIHPAANDNATFYSVLFLAVDLCKGNYQAAQLEEITRAVNYAFITPVFILFRYGKRIALGMAQKRPNKLIGAVDVVEAVRVVDNISCIHPQRVRMLFLHRLSFQQIQLNSPAASLNQFYEVWWDLFNRPEDIAPDEDEIDDENISILTLYFKEIQQYHLLEAFEEVNLTLMIRPVTTLFGDESNIPPYSQLLFFERVYQKFLTLCGTLSRVFDAPVLAELLLKFSDVVFLMQTEREFSNGELFTCIDKARHSRTPSLAGVLIRLCAALYLLPTPKLDQVRDVLRHKKQKGFGLLQFDKTIEPQWVKPAMRRLSAAQKFARQQLAVHNLRLVVHYAKKFQYSDLTLEDVIQEGSLGLIKAIGKYDLHKGTRFSTYATWWIRQSIKRAIADKGSLIRFPVHTQEDVQKFKRHQRKLERELLHKPTFLEIGIEAGLFPMGLNEWFKNEDFYRQIYSSSIPSVEDKVQKSLWLADFRCVSFNQPVGDDDGELGDFIEDAKASDFINNEINLGLDTEVQKILADLSDREKTVLEMRYGFTDGKDHTLQEISECFNVTRERIRQIEAKALKKIKHPSCSNKLKSFLP